MSTRKHAFLAALVVAVGVGSGLVHGDQLAWLDSTAASRAADAIPPGSLIVDWVSHCGCPTLYAVKDVKVVDRGDHAELRVKASVVAKGRLEGESSTRFWKFDRVRLSTPEWVDLDLAYVYVPSREVEGMFVNLGKKLGLECDVQTIAIEVPRAAFPEVAHLGSASVAAQAGR